MAITLNEDQERVVNTAIEHINSDSDDQFLGISGPAGCGKTTCMLNIVAGTNARTILTAPTNKAVRVIRETFAGNSQVQPPSCTIYSLLGLTLMPTGEVKQIGGLSEDLDLSDFDVVSIDEMGMLGTRICEYIDKVAEDNPRIRWILSGDRYQLPPVKEKESPAWGMGNLVSLSKVMRTDNQILTLATKIRGLIDKPGPLSITADNDGNEGVWSLSKEDFKKALVSNAEGFASGDYKAIAWRNATVEKMNLYIREALVGKQDLPWLAGERIAILEPIRDLMDDKIVASTDDEGIILEVTQTSHPLYRLFKVWHLRIRLEHNGQEVVAYSLHEDSVENYNKALSAMAEKAKTDRRLWRDYWSFRDSFNRVRHAWSITAHKSQGSTYKQAFVCWRDIVANPNTQEMLRCLYVAVSRPKERLYVG